jgi:regulatory protein
LSYKGHCREIVQILSIKGEIYWYLQAELAYNERFGAFLIKDKKDKAK